MTSKVLKVFAPLVYC